MSKLIFLTLFISLISSTALAGDTITAWGTIKVKDHAFGANVTGAKISLSCAPRSLINGVWNKFEFDGVPCEQGCTLKIEIRSPTTGQTVTYVSSYRFHKPPTLGGHRGTEAAGYLGDFLYDIPSSQILHTSRY